MFDRRHLFRLAGLFGAGSLVHAPRVSAAQRSAATLPPALPAASDPNVYASIGVRPLIDCRGTLTNVYDAAIRAVGVRIIEGDTPDALRLAIESTPAH